MTDAAFLGSDNFPRVLAREMRRAAIVGSVTVAALLFWAGTAPLAATLSIPGTVSSARPVLPLQHVAGGRLAMSNLRPTMSVRRGQLLALFDRTEARAELAALRDRIRMAEAEANPTAADGKANTPAAARVAAHRAEQARLLTEASLADRQAADLADAIAAAREKLTIADAAAERARGLANRGAGSQADAEKATEARIDAEDHLRATRAARTDALGRARLARAQAETAQAAFDASEAERRQTALAELVDLRFRAGELERAIAGAALRAPFDGTVVSAEALGPGQVFGPGQILAEIAAPLDQIEIDLTVPPRYVDQVTVGQKGTILLAALPQRQMPRIGVTVVGLSGAARHDPTGTVLGFAARARIDPADLAVARSALGPDFRLERDMPVVVLLEGHETTPLGYLVRPLANVVRRAFEEG